MAEKNAVEQFKDELSGWLDKTLKSPEGQKMMSVLYMNRPETKFTDNGFTNSGRLGALDGFDHCINMMIFLSKPNPPPPAKQPEPEYPPAGE